MPETKRQHLFNGDDNNVKPEERADRRSLIEQQKIQECPFSCATISCVNCCDNSD